jgi:drug/metabolite transporter (DMT)-like permease
MIAIWRRVPGGELLAGPIGGVWGGIGTLLSLVGGNRLADSLPSVGPVLLGALVIALIFVLLALTVAWGWSRWDEVERQAARQERLPALDRRFALAGGTLGVAALLTLDAAALVAGSGTRVGLILATGTVLGAALSALLVALMPPTVDSPSSDSR